MDILASFLIAVVAVMVVTLVNNCVVVIDLFSVIPVNAVLDAIVVVVIIVIVVVVFFLLLMLGSLRVFSFFQ